MIRRWLVIFVLCLAAWWLFRPAPAAAWTGRPAVEAPRQGTDRLPAPWKRDAYTFAALARFDARAVVLSRKNYSGDHDGELCPTDFALGWGAMSDAAVINALKISQDMRWFFYEWRGQLPVAQEEILASAANMHLIPANDDVRRELARVRRHELLEISGFLVEVKHPDGWSWRSSLSRTDSGAGSCEVVWVEHVAHRKIDAP